MDVKFYQDKASEWRWNVVSSNGNTVAASSEGFSSKHNAQRNLKLLADFLQLWKMDA
jgi:uncharacterized protein YegP (UPF0339 family)